MKIIRFIFSCLLLSTTGVIAQEYLATSTYLTVEDGLSGRYVKDIIEDQQGFIWISTHNGLDRYDGFSFKVFTKVDYGFNIENYNQLELDPNGNLWLINIEKTETARKKSLEHTFDVFDPRSETLITHKWEGKFPFEWFEVIEVKQSEDHQLWFYLEGGSYYRFDGANFHFVVQRNTDKFTVLANGHLMLVDNQQLRYGEYDQEGNQLFSGQLPSQCFYLSSGQKGEVVIGLRTDKSIKSEKNWFLLKEKTGLERIEFKDEKGAPKFKGQPLVQSKHLSQDKKLRWWLTLGSKLYVFNKDFTQIGEFQVGEDNVTAHLNVIHFDRFQSLWAGNTLGTYIFSLRENLFSTYLTGKDAKDTRGMVMLSEQEVFVNQKGTFKINLNQGSIEKVNINGQRGIYFDSTHQELWIGEYSTQAYQYSLAKNSLLNSLGFEDAKEEEKDNTGVNIIYSCSFWDTMFVGSLGRGLYVIDEQKQKLLRYRNVPSEMEVFHTADINSFYENQDGLWIGTSVGLFLLEKEKGITEYYSFPQKGVDRQFIHHIHEDAEGVFWLGTYNHGLIKWLPKEKDYRFYTKEDGLVDNTIYAVYEDNLGFLWMSCNFGLMRMNKANGTVFTFQETDGLPHKEFNATAHLQMPDSRLLFGGLGGVTSVYPDKIHQQLIKDSFQLVVSKIELNSDSIIQLFPYSKEKKESALEFDLDQNQTNLRIHLAAFDKHFNKQSHFAWKLNDSKSWNEINGNIFEINHLKFGENKIAIRGRNTNGSWAVNPIEVNFKRSVPFYLSAVFWAGIFLFCGLCIFLFFRSKEKNLKLEDSKQVLISDNESLLQSPKISQIGTDVVVNGSKKEEPNITVQAEKVESEKEDPQIEEKVLPTAFQQWLDELNSTAIHLIDEKKFSTIELAEAMNMSDRQLRRKMKQHDYMSPAAFMREIRLQRAEQLLKSHAYNTVSEVCYAVGFSTPKHFSRLFQKRFGRRPSSYQPSKSSDSNE